MDAANAASRICPLPGRFTAIRADGSCPPVTELATYSPNKDVLFYFGIYSDASNAALPKCPDQSAFDRGYKFRFRVDRVSLDSHVVDSAGQQTRVFDSVLFGTNLDANPACAVVVSFNSVSEQLSVAPGTVLHAARRAVVRTDQDVPGAWILYDEDQRILYSYASAVRPDLYAGDLGDLFPGLNIGVSSDVICRVPDADMSLVSAHLSTGSEVCDVDSHSERCCTLWGRNYEVQMIAALAPKSNQPYSTVAFTLRAPGYIHKAQ